MPVNEAIQAMRVALDAIAPQAVASTGRQAVTQGPALTTTVRRDGFTAFFTGRVYHVMVEIEAGPSTPKTTEDQTEAIYNYADQFLDWLGGAGRFGGMVVWWGQGVTVNFLTESGAGAYISVPICEVYPDA